MSVPVYDTFLFSERHEADMLLSKLNIEQGVVDQWIAVENAYTIKGARKSLELTDLLQEDSRFEPFLDRLHVISLATNFAAQYVISGRERAGRTLRRVLASRHAGSRGALVSYAEAPFFHAEAGQRDAALDRILELARGADALICVSDVDEMVDGSRSDRRDVVARSIRSGAGVVHLDRRRFAYDFDNMVLGSFRSVPCVRASALRAGRATLGRVRLDPQGVVASPAPVVFEYSYCYGADGLRRKLETFTHLDPGSSVVDQALCYNHQLKLLAPGVTPHYSYWHEQVDPEEAGHPTFVLDHLSDLRTGAVNPDYRSARRDRWPFEFGASATATSTWSSE